MNLDLGCGFSCQPGHLGVDRYLDSDASVVADLLHLPFRTGSVPAIYCGNTLEHFRRPEAVLQEAHRVLAPGGLLTIRIPHFSSPAAYGCPEHEWTPGLNVLRRWAYAPPRSGWRRRIYRLYDHVTADQEVPWWNLLAFHVTFPKHLQALGIERLANVYPELWEAVACWILPARDILAVLERRS